MIERHETVVVIGGGPAGLSAATALAANVDVLVIEREAEAGGVPRHCDHTGFGIRDLRRSLGGPAYARRLVRRAERAGVRIMTQAMVTGWSGDRSIEVTSPEGRMRITADAIVLATGARERPRAARRIPGDRPAGVFNTGQLQQAVHMHHQRIGRRAVVVGSELVGWSAVMTLREAGCRTVLVTTEYPKPDVYGVIAHIGRLLFRTRIRTSVEVTRIIGRGRVTGVELTHLGTGSREIVECDTVVLTGDWIPDHELARAAGVSIDPATLGPRVDASLRTDRPGIFAVGNLVHPVDTADVAALTGAHVASAVVSYLGNTAAPPVMSDISVVAPLRWVAPARFAADADRPARSRLLLWTDSYVRFPRVTARQDGRTLASRRLLWPAAPGRVFRVPWSLIADARAGAGPIEISVS